MYKEQKQNGKLFYCHLEFCLLRMMRFFLSETVLSVVILNFFMHFVVFSWEKYKNNMELYDFHVLIAIQYIYQLC